MVIQTITVSNCQPQTIVIGRRGTYDTLQIAFDLSYLVENYGSGTAVLAVKRSQDTSAYPAVASQADNILTWMISDVDTYYVGSGECQLMWYVEGGLAKTIIYPMAVMRDILATSEEAPDAYQTWVDNLTSLGAETLQNAQNAAQSASDAESAKDDAVTAKEAAEEAAETAQEAVVHAPIIQNGYWYIWNDGQYVDTGVRAEGQKGDKGDTGEKGDTGNGIASIAKTGTSGLVDTYTVTYTDGTTTTFTVTNGAKGDKGDTGATGNGIQSITKTGTSGNVDTYTIIYTNGQTTTFTVTNGAVSSVAGKTGAVTLDANDVAFSESGTYDDGTVGKELSNQKNAISHKAPLIINTASGDVASFADGADGMQIRKIVGTIVPQQAAGTPSPDNPLPISGWTGANITGAGKNLWNKDADFGMVDCYNYQETAVSRRGIVYQLPPGNYALSVATTPASTDAYINVNIINADESLGTYYSLVNGNNIYNRVITIGNDQKIVIFDQQATTASTATKFGNYNIQLEVGSTVSAFEEYHATTLPINWQTEAGTIYGGTVTLNEDGSVDVVATHSGVNLNTIGEIVEDYWIAYTNAKGYYLKGAMIGMKSGSWYTDPYTLCDTYAKVNSYNDFGVRFGNNNTNIFFCNVVSDYPTIEDWQAYISSADIHITYPIEPVTYHFDNIGELYTYLGTNNVWIDTGAITECDYPADTKLYIDGLTAPDEDMIANANIASGKYFVVNNQLYLSTAAIAAGASIVPGTNCTATNIAAALNAINT